jgi:hypothetical protein
MIGVAVSGTRSAVEVARGNVAGVVANIVKAPIGRTSRGAELRVCMCVCVCVLERNRIIIRCTILTCTLLSVLTGSRHVYPLTPQSLRSLLEQELSQQSPPSQPQISEFASPESQYPSPRTVLSAWQVGLAPPFSGSLQSYPLLPQFA